MQTDPKIEGLVTMAEAADRYDSLSSLSACSAIMQDLPPLSSVARLMKCIFLPIGN